MPLTARGPYVQANDLSDPGIVQIAAFLSRSLTTSERWIFEEQTEDEFDGIVTFSAAHERDPRVMLRVRVDDVSVELPRLAALLRKIEAAGKELDERMRISTERAAEAIESLMKDREIIPTEA